jgi:hypothetical protein
VRHRADDDDQNRDDADVDIIVRAAARFFGLNRSLRRFSLFFNAYGQVRFAPIWKSLRRNAKRLVLEELHLPDFAVAAEDILANRATAAADGTAPSVGDVQAEHTDPNMGATTAVAVDSKRPSDLEDMDLEDSCTATDDDDDGNTADDDGNDGKAAEPKYTFADDFRAYCLLLQHLPISLQRFEIRTWYFAADAKPSRDTMSLFEVKSLSASFTRSPNTIASLFVSTHTVTFDAAPPHAHVCTECMMCRNYWEALERCAGTLRS